MDLISTPDLSVLFMQLILAMFLGMLLGAERSIAGKTAGMRTYALVSVGSCLFVIISISVAVKYMEVFNFDPLRMASSIITGIGFLGAGLIIMHNAQLRGLTTAAGLWVSAGIGVAVGYGLYPIAIFTTFLTLVVFTLMWYIEERIKALPSMHPPIEQKIEE